MATFVHYTTYVPTPPRRRTPAPSKPVSKPFSNKLLLQVQRSRLGERELSTTQITEADDSRDSKFGFRADTDIVDSSNDDDEFPSIEKLLQQTLQREASTVGDQCRNTAAFEVGNMAAEEREGSFGNCKSAPSGSQEDPIMLGDDGDSGISEADVDTGLCAESAAENEWHLSRDAIHSTSPAPHSHPDEWLDIDDLLEMAQRSKQEPSSSDLMRPRTPSPHHASSELPSDHTSAACQYTVSTGSEVAMSCPARPINQLLDHLPIDQSAIDEVELVRPGMSSVVLDREETRGQTQEPEDEDSDKDNENGRRLQQALGEDAAAALISGEVDDTCLSSQKDESLGLVNTTSPQPSQDELGSHGDNHSDDELTSPGSDNEDGEPRPTKRKRMQPSSPNDRPTRKKQKHRRYSQQGSIRQSTPRLKFHRHYCAEGSAQRQPDASPTNPLGQGEDNITHGGIAKDLELAAVEPILNLNPANEGHGHPHESEEGDDDVNEGVGDQDDSESEDELTKKCDSETVIKGPRPTKQKRISPSHNQPMSKKRKDGPQRDIRYNKCGVDPESHHHSPMPRSPLNQRSRPPNSDVVVQLPSPVPSAPGTAISEEELPYNYRSIDELPGDLPVTLTEITFHPRSQHDCSFTAVVRDSCEGGVSFSQLTRLIASIGYVGKIDDFTIKPFQQHSFLLNGFSRHTPSQPVIGRATVVTAAEGSRIHRDTTRVRPQDDRALNTDALAPQQSELSSSDIDSGMSDSDPDLSSGDDGCLNKGKRGASTRTNIPWDAVDEQRLLAYKKEEKSWDWIFTKFPGRTPAAIRTRWTMVRRKS